jgi:hypothetical protein
VRGLDLAGFMQKINANAHSLCLSAKRSLAFGLGLFPLIAIFNHSCVPNVVYTNEGAKLVIRVLRPVARGQELCVTHPYPL